MTNQKPATLLVTSGGGTSPFLKHPVSAGRVDAVDIYDLADAPLRKYRALLLSMHSDQRHLFRHGTRLEAFLGGGGILIFSGHVAYPFLPELRLFEAIAYRQVEDLFVYRVAEHPIWQGVQDEDLTFRKGVAGFYGRGYNPPPPEATIINTLGPERLPLDYIYTRPGGGTVLIHAGNDFWSFGLFPTDTSSAALMPGQLLDWIETYTPGGDE